MSKCQECEKNEVYIHFGEEHLCLNCFNGRMTEELGVEATSYPEGVAIRDGLGEVHHFQLRKRLDPIRVIMEAEEQGTAEKSRPCVKENSVYTRQLHAKKSHPGTERLPGCDLSIFI